MDVGPGTTMDAKKVAYILRKNYVYLMQNLEPDEIVDFLLEDGIIDEDNCEEVENSPTTRRKIQLLLSFIRNRKDGYASFLNALDKSSSMEHIKEKLDCTDMEEYDATNSKNVTATKWTDRYYRQTSNIRRTSVGNKIVHNSDVFGASPVGVAPTTYSFST